MDTRHLRTEAARAKSLASRQALKDASQFLRNELPDLDDSQAAQVLKRLSQMPETCRATYTRAMCGKSRGAAVKAFCQECMGWQEFRRGIRDCTVLSCPLYPYRPYQEI